MWQQATAPAFFCSRYPHRMAKTAGKTRKKPAPKEEAHSPSCSPAEDKREPDQINRWNQNVTDSVTNRP
jgi:hypothetical protein